MRVLVTGGAGFIGSAVVRYLLNEAGAEVLNVDKLTYAGNKASLNDVAENRDYHFQQLDICVQNDMERVLEEFKPTKIMHLAAESHVDRSIDGPSQFIQTNIIGTYTLLEAARKYYAGLTKQQQLDFVFHHVSTDEVYGDLGDTTELFTENTPYSPSSPYSASKASSDHLVRAWNRTYGLPVVISNCSNNYGPYQFPEKFIPVIILNALRGAEIPIYGKGGQIRDWLYVEDHARALVRVMLQGGIGETYNIGGHNERTNLEVAHTICRILNDLIAPENKPVSDFLDLIRFVADRPGHDIRYAIDATKIARDLNWMPDETFESGMKKTVEWYLHNLPWCESVLTDDSQLVRRGLAQEEIS